MACYGLLAAAGHGVAMKDRADVLIYAIEAGRYGPARLPECLASAGLRVAVLCPDDNVLNCSDHVSVAFRLPASRAAPKLLEGLAAAVARCDPALVIPADEQAVALLHHAVWGGCHDVVDQRLRDLLLDSLAPVDRLSTMLFKHVTIELARAIGVNVPAGGIASTEADAIALADRLGYPVYVKRSFGWAGDGVAACADAQGVARGFAACSMPRPGQFKAWMREAFGRDWYPAVPEVDIQAAVAGKPAFYCALAWNGRMVGGFAGEALRTAGDNGPSTEVRLGPNRAMAQTCAAMIDVMECNGWIGFDFMVEADGTPVMIECNPRPVQVCHLGASIGVDLGAALAELLRGGDVPEVPLEATKTQDFVLFPYALDPARQRAGAIPDLPLGDEGLMRYGARLFAEQVQAA